MQLKYSLTVEKVTDLDLEVLGPVIGGEKRVVETPGTETGKRGAVEVEVKVGKEAEGGVDILSFFSLFSFLSERKNDFFVRKTTII